MGWVVKFTPRQLYSRRKKKLSTHSNGGCNLTKTISNYTKLYQTSYVPPNLKGKTGTGGPPNWSLQAVTVKLGPSGSPNWSVQVVTLKLGTSGPPNWSLQVVTLKLSTSGPPNWSLQVVTLKLCTSGPPNWSLQAVILKLGPSGSPNWSVQAATQIMPLWVPKLVASGGNS